MSAGRQGPSPSAVIARLRDQIAQSIAERQVAVVRALVHACFQNQRTPDGTPWPARADGSGKPLLLTLEDDVEIYSDGDAVYVDVPGKPHANFQFHGTHTIPSRPWAPALGEPLPPEWQERVDNEVREFIAAAWRAAR